MRKLIITFFSIILLLSCTKLPELGRGFRFWRDGKYTLEIVNSENTVMIRETILEYAYDSTFIIVCQRPRDSIPNIRTMNYSQSNKAFENSSFRQYWIINKEEKSIYSYDSISNSAKYSNVYGPFKKNEYIQKRKEFGIPNTLQLRKINY